jgi:hypothetical protein
MIPVLAIKSVAIALIYIAIYVAIVAVLGGSTIYTHKKIRSYAARILFFGTVVLLIGMLGHAANESIRHKAQSICNQSTLEGWCDHE